jgi:UDPglucose 6-dehydrogenase
VAPELRLELIRGAFSGDGTVTTLQQGKNFILEYATVSKPLADGMAMLLQSTIGIVPSMSRRMMTKSKLPAHILRVSGYSQLAQLADVFGGKRREQILNLLAGYQRHIRQRGFEKHGPYATLTVREVEFQNVETTVYSMETSTGTLIASSGIISHNCFPKDVKALAHMADEAGLHPQLLDAVMKINQDQRHVAVEKLEAHFEGPDSLKDKTIAVLGLAFKDNTDDMREAPSIDVINWLIEAGATVRVFDPVAVETAQKLRPDWEVTYCENEYEAAQGADGVVLVTEWKRFQDLDLERLVAAMNRDGNEPVFIDGRNLLDPDQVERAGFRYHGIGRGKVAHKRGTPDAGGDLQSPSVPARPFAVRGDR